MNEIAFESGSDAKPLDEGYVTEVENEIGIVFPPSYIDFMKKHNGGTPVQQCFFLGGNERVVERFLSFVPDYKTDELGIYDIEVVWSQIEDQIGRAHV